MQITASLIKSLVFTLAVATCSMAAPTSFSKGLDARSPMQAFRNMMMPRLPECTEEYAMERRSVSLLNGNALFWSSPSPPGWGPTSDYRRTFTQKYRKMQLRPDVWSESFVVDFSRACSGAGIDMWNLLSKLFASMAIGEVWFLGDDDLSDLNWAAERAIIMANPAVTSIIRFDRYGQATYLKFPATTIP